MESYIEGYLTIAAEMKEPYGKTQVESDYFNKYPFWEKDARDVVSFVNELSFRTDRPVDYFAQVMASTPRAKSGQQMIVIMDDPAIHPDVKVVLETILASAKQLRPYDKQAHVEQLRSLLQEKGYDSAVVNKSLEFVDTHFWAYSHVLLYFMMK